MPGAAKYPADRFGTLGMRYVGTGTRRRLGLESQGRIGKYRVGVFQLEKFLQRLDLVGCDSRLVLVDEIGKMESFSPVFVQAVAGVLNSPVPVVATIAAKGGKFIGQTKARPDVETITVTTENRNSLPADLASRLSLRLG